MIPHQFIVRLLLWNFFVRIWVDLYTFFIYLLRDNSIYCSAEGDQDKTEVYVVPQEEFLMWCKIQLSITDNGLKFYDSPPQKQV